MRLGKNQKSENAKKVIYRRYTCLSFTSAGQLYLLGYTLDEGVRLIFLEAVGPHEKFYQDLKKS